MKKVVVLGATGSIGTSTLSVIRKHPDVFDVVGLSACKPSDAIVRLAAEFPRAMVALAQTPDAAFCTRLKKSGAKSGMVFGETAAAQIMETIDADVCVAAISGTAGLPGAFVAARRGMTVLLANKEVLVSAGDLFMTLAADSGATVLPLDSEHAAVWQCLEGRDRSQIERLIITASGGPFWTRSRKDMAAVRPEDALAHPVWNMGAKISIDSATLANKSLEVMEAKILFGISRVDVLVHPQSVVHGMVEWRDGSTITHMGVCDMRQPINYMMFYPQPTKWDKERVNLATVGELHFYDPDYERFPLMRLGLTAGDAGGMAPAYFNAANEEAVGLFLSREIGFADMPGIVEKVMRGIPDEKPESVEHVLEAHERARILAREAAGVLVSL